MDQLIEQYKQTKTTLTEKQKSELEREIWFQYSLGKGRGFTKDIGQREWFRNKFGGTAKEYQDRASLINAGSWVEPLWQKLDSGLAISTAINLMRKARNFAAASGFSYENGLKKALEEYESLRLICHNSSGKEFRKSAPFSKSKSKTGPVDNSGEFFRQVKILTEELLNVKLMGVDSYLAEQTKTEFLDWIKEGYENLKKSIYKQRNDMKKENMAKIGRTRFAQACEVLGIQSAFGKPINLHKVKKAKFFRVKPLHPDKNSGSHAHQEEYQAVIEAYNLLEEYARQIGTEK